MDIMTIISIACFVLVVIYLAKMIVLRLEHQADEDALRAKEVYQEIIEQKDKAAKQKNDLQKQAKDMFTLYDLTREMTKNFNEEEIFSTFHSKLIESVTIEECRLVEVDSDELNEVEAAGESKLFALKENEGVLGFLAYRGLSDKDEETFSILAHQFTLALRRSKLYKQIEQMAITDSLTGVHTRRYFMERFEEEIARAKSKNIPLSFLMIDADHFKKFNDEFGHLTGDQILREIALVVKDNIRAIDFVGRYGGEEFCVVLPDTDAKGAQLVGERMRREVEKAVIHAYDATVRATVSIGVASYPHDGQKTDELVDKADWALYRAKKQGRNAVCTFGVYGEE